MRRRSLSLCSLLAYGWVRVRLFGSLVLFLFTHSVTFISLGIMQTFLLDSEPIGFKGAGDQIWIDYKPLPTSYRLVPYLWARQMGCRQEASPCTRVPVDGQETCMYWTGYFISFQPVKSTSIQLALLAFQMKN